MRNFRKIFLISFLLTTGCLLLAANIFASTIDELRQKINEDNKKMAEIEKEIQQYENEISKATSESKTLKNQIYQLELNRKKIASEINLTQQQIQAATLNIQSLDMEIQQKIDKISKRKDTLAETVRNINETESASIVEIVLSEENFSEFFNNLENVQSFQKEINVNLKELRYLKEALEEKKSEKEIEKNKLGQFKSRLVDQKTLVEINKTDKNKLLTTTKNKESNYKNILAQKIKLKEAFEQELLELESQLKIIIDPNSLPSAGKGVLKWPFTDAKMTQCGSSSSLLGNIYCVTQYFGNTPFASANPQLYKSGTHNGIDFRASEGTEILASLDGIVKGAGDTDKTCKSASYGKWILIEHDNGLSTLYAHLSLIKVSSGQKVSTRQLIGYSGNSGSSTGPHLHYTVYATKGVQISSFPSKVCSDRVYTIPVASFNSYLNPLSYL
ncbi:MAG: peptidoglycan DD-metalloendopeptidase family protein [Candidatus Paceibacterota bacterium]